ncbi:MAG TPA: DUF6671 family protein [Coriobacteriia bacterium]|nr:DUF6671 family protein [Coriobacteriia bacterium]
MSPAPYAGARVALLTQHGKERVIAPVLEEALSCTVVHVTGYDTDLLGTFTRETPRSGTQFETAVRKARLGMELAGLPLGVASEGSFVRDPYVGLLPWNIELLVLVDDVRGIEVTGVAQGKANSAHLLTADWPTAQTFARESGFPEHHLVVRPVGEDDPRVRKGLDSWETYEAAFGWARGLTSTGDVFVEVDLRAHANPTRMENIRRAADDLVARLLSACPACDAPGFGVSERVPGLPCRGCGLPTAQAASEIWSCRTCGLSETRGVTGPPHAEPERCGHCNP